MTLKEALARFMVDTEHGYIVAVFGSENELYYALRGETRSGIYWQADLLRATAQAKTLSDESDHKWEPVACPLSAALYEATRSESLTGVAVFDGTPCVAFVEKTPRESTYAEVEDVSKMIGDGPLLDFLRQGSLPNVQKSRAE